MSIVRTDAVLFYRPDQRRDRGKFADEGRGRKPGQRIAGNTGMSVAGPVQEQMVRVAMTNKVNMFDVHGVKKLATDMGFTDLAAHMDEHIGTEHEDDAKWFGELADLADEVEAMRGSPNAGVQDVSMDLGVTPYRGKPIAETEGVEGYYNSTRYKGWLTDLRVEAKRLNVGIEDVVKVTGIWAGNLEPSASVWVKGTPDNIKALAGSLGGEYNQEGVMMFTGEDDGVGALYTMPGIQDRDKAVKAMQHNGVLGGRIAQTRNGEYALEVADADGSDYDNIVALGKELGVQILGTPGTVTFLEGDKHYKRRKRPHKGRGITNARVEDEQPAEVKA